MDPFKDKEMDFVLKFYQYGKLNTRKALLRFKEKKHLTAKPVRRVYLQIAKIAAIFLLALLPVGAYLYIDSLPKWVEITAGTEIKEIRLPDFSQITLAPHSSLKYDSRHFSEKRDVEMKGKAFFQIFHDAGHPFTVRNKWSRVKVLGTEFQVDGNSEEIIASVESGKVFFSSYGKTEGITLTQGMVAILTADAEKPHYIHPVTRNALAWKSGWFEYDNTPLPVVLDELSKYYHLNLSVANGKNKFLSGRFSTDNPRIIIENIEKALDVNIKNK